MYIDIVPTRTSPPAVLLRQARREGGKIVKTTLAHLSTCPPEAVEALRLALRGVALDPCSKLATTRVWHTTTLAQELGVDDADGRPHSSRLGPEAIRRS